MKKYVFLLCPLFFLLAIHVAYSQYSPIPSLQKSQKISDDYPPHVKADLHLLWSQKDLLPASEKDTEPEKTKRKSQYINWAAIGIITGTIVGFKTDLVHPLYGAIFGGLIGLGVDVLEWWIFK